METFPIVRRSNEKTHGRRRTADLTLEIYDSMAKVGWTGNGCQTRCNPRPADPRAADPVPEPRRKVDVRA